MPDHEIYTFGPGMRIFNDAGELKDPLTEGGGGSGSGGLLVAGPIELTADDINNLQTVAVEAIAAPEDPTKTNVPVSLWLDTSPGDTPFTTAATLYAGYATDPTAADSIISLLAANLNDAVYPLSYWQALGGSGYRAGCRGQAVVLKTNGPISGGNGSAKVTMLYFVV